jgi:ribonuclease P protein component
MLVRTTYTRQQRLTKADEFSSVFSLRKCISVQYFQAFIKPTQQQGRLGLVVAKRIERRAVGRNYMKRMIREQFRLSAGKLQGFDVVVRVTRPFGRAETQVAQAALQKLWDKIELCHA